MSAISPRAGILITGSTGYVGQNLCKRLNEEGVAFRVLTRRSFDGLELCRQHIGSIEDAHTVDIAVAKSDLVVHLACMSLPECQRDAEGCFVVNVIGTENVARSCAQHGVSMLLVSTSEVYGFKTKLPIGEDDEKLPISTYGAHKLQAELSCHGWGRIGSLRYRIIRLFNIYGPAADGSPRRTVETIFLDRARQGLPMKIIGNATSSRDFLYIDDAITALMDSTLQWAEFAGETLNIASGCEHTLFELARLACELTDKSFDDLVSVEETSLPIRYCADISRARQLLAFEPKVALREGLMRVLKSLSAFQA